MLSFTALYSVQIRYFVCRERGALVSKRERERELEALFCFPFLSLSLSLCLLHCLVCSTQNLFSLPRIKVLSLPLSLSLFHSFSLLGVVGAFFHIYWSVLPCSYTFNSVARAHSTRRGKQGKTHKAFCSLLLSFTCCVDLVLFFF